jgi:hypothetical protein
MRCVLTVVKVRSLGCQVGEGGVKERGVGADTWMMWRSLFAVVVVAALSNAAVASGQPKRAVSANSYVRLIIPNVGVGGVRLGESLSDVHNQLGRGLSDTGIGSDGNSEYWLWATTATNDLMGPLDALTVDYAYIDGKPGPASLLATPGAWAVSGTAIVSHRHGSLAALRRFYGKRLLGPYLVGPPAPRGGSSDAYYELPGRYLGRPVHTLFETTTYKPLADEIVAVTVSFCVTTPLFRSALDIACHATRS